MAQTISATDTELQKPVNAMFVQTFLRRAQQNCPYFMGTSPGTLNKQAGTSTIKWRRIEQETPSTSALTELTATATYMQNRNADTPTFAQPLIGGIPAVVEVIDDMETAILGDHVSMENEGVPTFVGGTLRLTVENPLNGSRWL